jgi:hypothetical protein
MWIRQGMVAEVEKAARVFYIDQALTQRWNEHRKADEPRLMTGWCWQARSGEAHRTGIKTVTACYIDAWYALVAHQRPPRVNPRALRAGPPASRRAA